MVKHLEMNSRIIRWPEVHAKVGYCRTNIYYLVKSGDFPAPIKVEIKSAKGQGSKGSIGGEGET